MDMKDKLPEFFFTKEEMVKDLLAITPIKPEDVVLDAGSGNLVWFKNLPCLPENRRECEIERGCDFYEWKEEVDWVVGNPPFRDKNGKNQIPSWIEKSSTIARKGFAFLINHKVFNCLTPRGLEKLKERGFYLQHIRIVSDKRWFGRYYYLIWGRENKNFVSWELKSY